MHPSDIQDGSLENEPGAFHLLFISRCYRLSWIVDKSHDPAIPKHCLLFIGSYSTRMFIIANIATVAVQIVHSKHSRVHSGSITVNEFLFHVRLILNSLELIIAECFSISTFIPSRKSTHLIRE